MKRRNYFLIALVFVVALTLNFGTAIAQNRQNDDDKEIYDPSRGSTIWYFIENTNDRTITIHTSKRFPNRFEMISGGEVESNRYTPSRLIRRLKDINSIETLYIGQYDIQISKKENSDWEPIVDSTVRALAENYKTSVKKTEPAKRDSPCTDNSTKNAPSADELPNSVTMGGHTYQLLFYWIECAPNRDVITINFTEPITSRTIEMYYNGILEEPSSDLMVMLQTNDFLNVGVTTVFIKEKSVSITRASVFEWEHILQRVIPQIRLATNKLAIAVAPPNKNSWSVYPKFEFKKNDFLGEAWKLDPDPFEYYLDRRSKFAEGRIRIDDWW